MAAAQPISSSIRIHGHDGSCISHQQSSCPTSINSLPDSILRFIGEYLPNSSRAMMASALSRPACFDSDTLDFSDVKYDIAYKLTDRDVRDILVSIDAVNRLKVLKLIGCENISGIGLEPMRGSTTIQQIDLTTSYKASTANGEDLSSPNVRGIALSEDAVIPILDSIIAKNDRALMLLELPLVWRKTKSTQLAAFMERYSRAQSSRTCWCRDCGSDFQAYPWMIQFKGSSDWGLQLHTCYECKEHICDDCEGAFCDECKKTFCNDCCPMEYCGCGKASCMNCFEVLFCESCNESYCSDCRPVCVCDCCDRIRCMDCVMHTFCSHCTKSNCEECSNEHTVEWCEVCEEGHCNDCRFAAFKDGSLDCKGCRGALLPRIIREKEALQRENEMLKLVVLNAVKKEIAQEDPSKVVYGEVLGV